MHKTVKSDKQTTRKIALFAILLALATLLGYLDRLLCLAIPFLSFYAKIGFANIVLVVVIYRDGWWSSLLMGFLKSLFIGLIVFSANGIITFQISLVGTLLSIVAMNLVRTFLKNSKSMVIASLVGGFTHPIGQLLAIYLIYQSGAIFKSGLVMLPLLVVLGSVTGAIIGVLAQKVYKVVDIIEDKN